MKRILVVALLLIGAASLTGCARASEATLDDVVDGTATPENYVRATVTDSRAAEELLVELTSGEATIWATGFAERPGRGAEVWTAVVGPPTDHDLVGLAYPTAGELEAPEEGITETGALGVSLGILALVGVLVAALAGALARLRGGRRCAHCGARAENGWITCTDCGRSLQPEAASRPPTPATMFSTSSSATSSATTSADPVAAAEEQADETDDVSERSSAGTRIFRRDR